MGEWMKSKLYGAVLGIGLVVAAAGVQAGELRITIRNVESEKGKVMIALYNSEANYKSDDLRHASACKLDYRSQGLVMTARKGNMTAVFADLPPGQYGVAVFQDVNDNGKLDSSFVGMPTEPYGFGNDAPLQFGPPEYKDVILPVGDGVLETVIRLRS
jgi:uncharacterized protein (DUF2141 family)